MPNCKGYIVLNIFKHIGEEGEKDLSIASKMFYWGQVVTRPLSGGAGGACRCKDLHGTTIMTPLSMGIVVPDNFIQELFLPSTALQGEGVGVALGKLGGLVIVKTKGRKPPEEGEFRGENKWSGGMSRPCQGESQASKEAQFGQSGTPQWGPHPPHLPPVTPLLYGTRGSGVQSVTRPSSIYPLPFLLLLW